MNDVEKILVEFPAELRSLVECELKVGNEIVAIGREFPATPIGAYVKLAKPVSEKWKSENGIIFCDRNDSDCSGEFTTAARDFFVLEPPRPEAMIPDMDAIRKELKERERASDEKRFRELYY